MDTRPEQPPEGRLIADAADRLTLSIREAARRAGLSYGRWRQITAGYQNVSPGVYAPVRAPAKTLAKMAAVVGITAGQMETEGQRPDAAEIMRREPQPAPLAAVPAAPLSFERGQDDLFPDMDPATRAEVDARAPGIREAVIAAAIKGPLTGAAIFPDPVEAERWDRLTGIGQGMEPGKGFTPWQMVQFMAIGRINDERHRAGNQPRRVRGVLIPI